MAGMDIYDYYGGGSRGDTQEISNAQPGVRRANQRGQRPNFFGAAPPTRDRAPLTPDQAPRGPQIPAFPRPPMPTDSPEGPQVGQPQPKFFQPGFTPSSWVSGPNAPPAPPEVPSTGGPGSGGPGQAPNGQMSALVRQLVDRLAQSAPTDTTGIKEGQKEALIAQREQQRMAAEASAARRGVGGGGNLGAQEATLGDQFAGNLTGAYREVDQAAVAQDFERLMQTAQLAESVGNNEMAQFFQQQALDLQRELGRGNLDVQRQQVGNQASQYLQSQAFQEALAAAGMDQNFWQMLMQLMG